MVVWVASCFNFEKKCMHSCPFPCWKKWNFLGACKILSWFWCVLGVGLWLGWTFAEIFGRPSTYVVAYKSCASHNFQVPKVFFLWKLYRMYFILNTSKNPYHCMFAKILNCIKPNAVITKKLAQGWELPRTTCGLWQTGLAKSTH